MSEWQTIETAPKDGAILVFGQPRNMMTGNASVEFNRPAIFTRVLGFD